MEEPRLFDGPPEVLLLSAVYVVPHGWRLTVRMRRAGEPWADVPLTEYYSLTSPELLDVICLEAAVKLALS